MESKWFCRKCVGNKYVEVKTIANIFKSQCVLCGELADFLVCDASKIIPKKKLRQLRIDEFQGYEWEKIREAGSEYPIYIKGLKSNNDLPPLPDDVYLYELKEVTIVSDTERKYIWVPVMTYEPEK